MNSNDLTDVMVDEFIFELGLTDHVMDVASPRKGVWTPLEDTQLLQALGSSARTLGTNWNTVALGVPGRNGRQVRERYVNILNPTLNIHDFSDSEDAAVLSYMQKHGPRWSLIAAKMAGRSPNAIRNRANKLRRQTDSGRGETGRGLEELLWCHETLEDEPLSRHASSENLSEMKSIAPGEFEALLWCDETLDDNSVPSYTFSSIESTPVRSNPSLCRSLECAFRLTSCQGERLRVISTHSA